MQLRQLVSAALTFGDTESLPALCSPVWCCPLPSQLIPALLDHPLTELDAHVHSMPGVPVKPMLAKPTAGVSEVLDKFTGIEFTCEYKYDGERVQVRLVVGVILSQGAHD